MTFSILIEKIKDNSLPDDYYYAYIPSLDLTTHGLGIEGAKSAAIDLINLWIEEKISNNEYIPIEEDVFFSRVEINNAIFS